jgi:glutathione S-transferase
MVEMVMAVGGIPYRTVNLDMRGGEQHGEAYRALNPAGWIPALETPAGDVLYETPAINLWLCETHGLDLVPAVDDPDRGRFLSAFFNVTGEIEPAMKRVFFPARYVTDPEDAEAHRALAWQAVRERLEPVDKRLAAGGPFFLGERFSLADLTLAYWTLYVRHRSRIEDLPAVARALDMTRERPVLAERFDLLERWINR